MKLIRFALLKPVSIIVLVATLVFFGIRAVNSVKIDILPQMNLPVIYLAHPFGGYTPDQMEAYFGKAYVGVFIMVNGVKSIESKNIQGLTLMKLTFYEGTDMAQAAAEVSAFSNRMQVAFPPGSAQPFIVRFDASSLPVGQLVLSSDTRSNNEMQDLANTVVRSSFTAIPGLLSSPPFGGSPRTIEVNVDPDKLRAHSLTIDQVVEAIQINNRTAPPGGVRFGDLNYLTPTNNTLREVREFERIPLFKGEVNNLTVGDVATVKDGADLVQGYALVNGKRSVYLSVARSADASTWEVVKQLKANLPRIQSMLPPDVRLTYEFDQSVYVLNAVKSLVTEGAIGAFLTGLMVVLFLGDRRAALIVVLTIPISVIASVLFLQLFGQTINLMTLSGLALSIGILVDESTVTIENIHQHLERGKPKARAIWDACKEIALPKLLILLSILAVFVPALTMDGIPGALFLPLSLAIGFAMVTSFLLSQTFVPVMANWTMQAQHGRKEAGAPSRFQRFKTRFLGFLGKAMPVRKAVSIGYLAGATLLAVLAVTTIGRDVFPKVNSGQFQLRMRAPDGTRMERTEKMALQVLDEVEGLAGKEHVSITSAYVGMHPAQYSVSPIYLFMAGPHEAVFQVALKDLEVDMDAFKDELRARVGAQLPEVRLSFEPIELTDRILSQGATTPIEVRVSGKDKRQNAAYAQRLADSLATIPYMRDVQIAQSFNYPALDIDIDRTRAAQLGVDMNDVSRSLVASTSSSRYTEKNMWVDERSGQAYNVQVQVPTGRMRDLAELEQVPLRENATRPMLSDVARVTRTTTNGENDNMGTMPYLSVTANIDHKDLGHASRDVQEAIGRLGELPRGLFIDQVGLGTVLDETLTSLEGGLFVAIVVIFLMLAANFQSFRVPLVVLAAVPAVVLGALLLLLLTGSTLNLQSYMGIIMSVGVSIANAVLLVTNAEQIRLEKGLAPQAAMEAAGLRVRPIIMTTVAMVVGMLPMAIGHGEGGEQVAPLGRAVIGGLLFSTCAVLLVLPLLYTWVQGKATLRSVSLHPDDERSMHYDPIH